MIFQKYYYPARLKYKVKSLSDYNNQTPIIIVYQMAKVGSSTVVASLNQANLNMPIYHIHALTEQGLKSEEKAYYGPRIGILCHSLLPRTTHLFEGYYLRDLMKRGSRNLKVVTLTRDPIARNISAFFQGMDLRVANFHNRLLQNRLSVDEVINLFHESIKVNPDYHATPLKWFDQEFNNAMKIDVYSEDFPKSKGFKLYNAENTSALLIKLEKLTERFSEASSVLLNKKGISVEPRNDSKQKIYHNLYKEFKKSITLPEEYLELMYNSKYAKHFYSENEIEAFMIRWGN